MHGLFSLPKEYIVDMWEIRKQKLYDSDSGPGLQIHSQSSRGYRNGKFSHNGRFGQKNKFDWNRNVHLGLNLSRCAHFSGCVVNSSNTMAAI